MALGDPPGYRRAAVFALLGALRLLTEIEAWPRERWQVPRRRFLDAFYRAQRGLLEQKLLFGQRRERKQR